MEMGRNHNGFRYWSFENYKNAWCHLGDCQSTHKVCPLLYNKIEEKTITNTRDKVYRDLIQVPIRPVIRAQAKKFIEALNGLIQVTWAQLNSWRPTKGIAHDKCMIQALEVSQSLSWNMKLACTLWQENILLFFLDTFLFLEEASG